MVGRVRQSAAAVVSALKTAAQVAAAAAVLALFSGLALGLGLIALPAAIGFLADSILAGVLTLAVVAILWAAGIIAAAYKVFKFFSHR